MTEFERLSLQADVIQIDLLCLITKALGAYHDGAARNFQEKLEAMADSVTADEVHQLK